MDKVSKTLLAASAACFIAAATMDKPQPHRMFNDELVRGVNMNERDAANLLRAEKNHDFDKLQKEWAWNGGVPDVIAWQTPEGRARLMAAKAASDSALLPDWMTSVEYGFIGCAVGVGVIFMLRGRKQ